MIEMDLKEPQTHQEIDQLIDQIWDTLSPEEQQLFLQELTQAELAYTQDIHDLQHEFCQWALE